jgi:hypothetical protein
MPNTKSHDRQSRRQYFGEQNADQVLACLNRDFPGNQGKLADRVQERVLAILEAMKKAIQSVRDGQLSHIDVADALHPVNKFLFEYPMYQVFSVDETPRRWRVGYSFPTRRIYGSRKTTTDAKVIRAIETLAVHGLVCMAEANLLDRFQLCTCGRWYFARFPHQKFCSPDCRVKFWESSEERKAQKRERAREYYRFHKIHDRG